MTDDVNIEDVKKIKLEEGEKLLVRVGNENHEPTQAQLHEAGRILGEVFPDKVVVVPYYFEFTKTTEEEVEA